MNHLPKARTENIVMQNLKNEILIYDLSTDQAFCLNETAAKVFNACDGATGFEKLKSEHQLTNEIIFLALDRLKIENLLAEEYVSPFAKMNRRDVIKKVGLTTIALPSIFALAAPTAANAASNVATNQANGQTCSTAQSGGSGQCRSGYCVQTSDGVLRCCTAQSSTAGTPEPADTILSGPASTCNQRIATSCCSGSRATQYGQLCVCN